MLGRICVHLGKFYVPHHEKDTINVSVFDCSVSSENSSEVFKDVLTIRKRNMSDIKWFGIASVFSYQTKLRVIVILIQLQSDKLSVQALISKSDLSEISCFSCSSSFLAAPGVNIAVTDGPTITYIQESELCIASVMFDLTQTYDLRSYLSKNVADIHILQFDSYESCYKQNKLIVYVIVLQSLSSSEKKVNVFAILQILESGKFYSELYNISNHVFFSSYYQTIISAVKIAKTNISEDLSRKKNEETWDMEFFFAENRTVICTNEKFLIFQNGFLKHCCDIGISDVNRIISVPQSNLSEAVSFFLRSATSGISFVTIKDSDKYECSETWENAVQIYFGDFLNNCSKQISLLTNTEFDSWQDQSLFLLYPSLAPIAAVQETDMPDEHMKTTITSLQKRVTYGKAATIEAECRIAQKTSVISSILKGFRNQCSRNPLPGQSVHSSLVDIMNYKDQSPQTCEEALCEEKELTLHVVDHWQLVLASHWFLGWVFRNVSDNCVTNLNASLLLHKTSMEYRQRVFIDNSRDFSIRKAEKRHALPSEEMTIVTCMEIPTFIEEDIETSCVISWNIGVASNPVNDALFPSEIKGPCQQQPFQVILKVKDVLNRDVFSDCSNIYQLMSIRTLQDSILVEITSASSSLSVLETLAIQRQKMFPPKILEIEDTKCLYFMDERSSLFGVNMSWDQLNKNTIEAEIFARTEKEMMLFIQWLYSILPRDVGVLAKEFTQEEQSQLQRKLLIALKEEVDYLRMVLTTSSAESDENKTKGTEPLESDSISSGIHNRSSSSEMRKGVIMKQTETDNLMADFIAANQKFE